MKKIVGVVILFCILLGGCKEKKVMYKHASGKIYGTTYNVVYECDEDLHEGMRKPMQRVNKSLSMFDSTSVIAQINRGNVNVTLDSLFIYLFNSAKDIYTETGGAFDITVAPLVNAWGFGYKNNEFPTDSTISSLMEHIGFNKVRLENGQVIKQSAHIEMDASAIAKGLGVDLVAEYLDSVGCTNYMVEIGGEVRVMGQSDKQRAWRIGIDKPMANLESREIQMVVGITSGSIATSGNYRNFYEKDGKRYAHTINPLTGYPVQTNVLSASVYTESCMIADAYATAFMVLGLERSKQIVESNPAIEACLIYEDKGKVDIWMSSGFEKLVVR
ncbi:MAG: FAD:protein FMN transferase [Marinifilaceae bacterium]